MGNPTTHLPSRIVVLWLIRLLRFHLSSFLVAMIITMIPALVNSQESTSVNHVNHDNLTKLLSNYTRLIQSNSSANLGSLPRYGNSLIGDDNGTGDSAIHRTATVAQHGGVPKEFPSALVIASSIAAVSILVFFFVSYYWHTHQLDSRARKLAIRMAADAEHSMRCSNCNHPSKSQAAPSSSRSLNRGYIRAASDSSQEPNACEVLTIDEEKGDAELEAAGGSMGGRSSVVVSESDGTVDPEDVFEPSDLPQLSRNPRGSVTGSLRGGRGGSHRKWSRSRKSSGPPLEGKRDSAVTDKEILTHFASRRHSTFFI